MDTVSTSPTPLCIFNTLRVIACPCQNNSTLDTVKKNGMFVPSFLLQYPTKYIFSKPCKTVLLRQRQILNKVNFPLICWPEKNPLCSQNVWNIDGKLLQCGKEISHYLVVVDPHLCNEISHLFSSNGAHLQKRGFHGSNTNVKFTFYLNTNKHWSCLTVDHFISKGHK